MKTVAISEFKAKCLQLLEQVQKTKQPLVVTKRGRPIAEVGPVLAPAEPDWMGSMKGRIEILGDIVSPASDQGDWEALRD
jgi:prevent-host-death family protein